MTRAAIVETLSKDFSADAEAIRSVLEMLDAGLTATYIGRFRRGDTRLTESVVRRLERRREELVELDRRRGTILRMLSGRGDKDETPEDDGSFPEIRGCMDRFEMEDLFLPYRRPEPEVQLALDRGLGELADRIVAPSPRARKQAAEEHADPDEAEEHVLHGGAATHGAEEVHHDHHQTEAADDSALELAQEEAVDGASENEGEGEEEGHDHREHDRGTEHQPVLAELTLLKETIEVTPGLARLCAEYVNPDRGVHTEEEALTGALRILSDRLGRDPGLRRAVRKALRKQGILTVRGTGDDSRLQRHRALLKTKEPLRQLQSRKLLRLRQAQKDRAITTTIHLDPALILPRVRKTLGSAIDPEFAPAVDAVCVQALTRRLVPMIEADIRLELKERADEEALRFLSHHLRQILLTPVAGRRAVAGLATSAKQDWIIVLLDPDGNPTGPEVKLETRDKEDAVLAQELGAALSGHDLRAIAVGNGKGSLAQVPRLRACLRLIGLELSVFIVNEAGLTSYANSELARKELEGHGVPARMAISLGRRFQDLLLEILKVDPRNLGLGMEAGLVSKANLRRALQETVESACAFVGCDVNTAPVNFLRRLPGLDAEAAQRVAERRATTPFQTREELRASGVLTEAQWVSAAAFLRVTDSPEPLDRTNLHPDQYPLARRLAESSGGNLEDTLGARGATKGLRRADFDIDETTWRDLVRELSFPGRDPRLRLFPPILLPADTDVATLQPGQVLEGIVTNLTSFGAFVDLGIPKEGLVHISETSNRYVRDAREALSIGQVVRARLLDANGQRITLSLKDVPELERKRPQRTGGGGRRRERPEREGEREGAAGSADWAALQRTVRAAQTRRDGLAGSGAGKRGRGKGGRKEGSGGSGGPSSGGPRRDGRRGGGAGGFREEEYDVDAVRKAQSTSIRYNPFAAFFEKPKEPEPAPEGADS